MVGVGGLMLDICCELDTTLESGIDFVQGVDVFNHHI